MDGGETKAALLVSHGNWSFGVGLSDCLRNSYEHLCDMNLIVNKLNVLNWFLQRISGVLLLALLPLHLWRMHAYNQEEALVYKLLLQHISASTWKVMEILLLALVVYHALNGIFALLRDYIHKPALAGFLSLVLLAVGIAALILG
jgi:succinate dehydrogenase cytochrome b556 subunit